MGVINTKEVPEEYKHLHKELAFDKRELRQWYTVFIKQCPCGHMCIEDFTQLYQARQSGIEEDAYITHLCARHVFALLDENGDEQLDFEEFARGLAMINRGKEEDRLKWVFDMIDISKSGYLTHDDLMELLVALQFGSSGNRDQKHHDHSNADKLLTICQMEAQRMIKLMDLDNDDRITFDEFQKTASNDPLVIRLLTRI